MKNWLLLSLLSVPFFGMAQENLITLSGGYVFANIEEFDSNTTGWRISGSYEFNPMEEAWAHGVSFGYISTSAIVEDAGLGILPSEYNINNIPIYYAPKFLFGGGAFKGYVKGAIGVAFSNYERIGPSGSITGKTQGFFGGLGAGAMMSFNRVFINLEYEWAYMGNSYYRDGFVNSVMLGVGYKF
jgi:hypothetical protein